MVLRGEVDTNEMPLLQSDVSFWQVHPRRRQAEAAKALSVSPEKLKGKEDYLGPHEIYKWQ